jgi:hypothetical protein
LGPEDTSTGSATSFADDDRDSDLSDEENILVV